jgi:hypothetical protein
MKNGFAILAAVILVLAAAYWAHGEHWFDTGRYQLYPALNARSEPIAWRLDTRTGALAVCKIIPEAIGPDGSWCEGEYAPHKPAPQ